MISNSVTPTFNLKCVTIFMIFSNLEYGILLIISNVSNMDSSSVNSKNGLKTIQNNLKFIENVF